MAKRGRRHPIDDPASGTTGISGPCARFDPNRVQAKRESPATAAAAAGIPRFRDRPFRRGSRKWTCSVHEAPPSARQLSRSRRVSDQMGGSGRRCLVRIDLTGREEVQRQCSVASHRLPSQLSSARQHRARSVAAHDVVNAVEGSGDRVRSLLSARRYVLGPRPAVPVAMLMATGGVWEPSRCGRWRRRGRLDRHNS